MRLQLLVTVGLGSVALAGLAAGAPVTAAAGAMMLAATALRNTTTNPETCLTFDKKEKYCHYKNTCDFPLSATSGRGVNIIPSKGRASCLTDDNGPIPPDRGDVTIKTNPKARDCVVVNKRTKEEGKAAGTDIRNHCNKAVKVTIEEVCDNKWEPTPFLVPKKETLKTPIKFKCFGEDNIKVEFDTKKTNN